VPLGTQAWFASNGIGGDVTEMDWWDEIPFSPTMKIVALPSNHW
jgi:hypothetical protein